jgi:hypothetical protein
VIVVGAAFHVAAASTAFSTSSTTLATLSWAGAFGGATDVQWTNDGTVGTTADVVVVYSTTGPAGTLRLAADGGGATADVTLSATGTQPAGYDSYRVAVHTAGVSVPSGSTVTLTAKVATAGTLSIRSIDIVPRAA